MPEEARPAGWQHTDERTPLALRGCREHGIEALIELLRVKQTGLTVCTVHSRTKFSGTAADTDRSGVQVSSTYAPGVQRIHAGLGAAQLAGRTHLGQSQVSPRCRS